VGRVTGESLASTRHLYSRTNNYSRVKKTDPKKIRADQNRENQFFKKFEFKLYNKINYIKSCVDIKTNYL
jgi:hypothetical protein